MSFISQNRRTDKMRLAFPGCWVLKRAFASTLKNHFAVCREENVARYFLHSTAV